MRLTDSADSGARDPEQERALANLRNAAYLAVLTGASVDDILAAYEDGVMEALDSVDRQNQALRDVGEIQRRYGSGYAA